MMTRTSCRWEGLRRCTRHWSGCHRHRELLRGATGTAVAMPQARCHRHSGCNATGIMSDRIVARSISPIKLTRRACQEGGGKSCRTNFLLVSRGATASSSTSRGDDCRPWRRGSCCTSSADCTVADGGGGQKDRSGRGGGRRQAVPQALEHRPAARAGMRDRLGAVPQALERRPAARAGLHGHLGPVPQALRGGIHLGD